MLCHVLGANPRSLLDTAVKPDPFPEMLEQFEEGIRLRRLGLPVCHGLPSGFDYFEDEVRVAEGFFAVLASLGGTEIYRTHEVSKVRAVLSAMADLEVSTD